MTATTGDRLLTDYLARLETAALRLPPDQRTELMEGIAEHVSAARAAGELHDEAAVRTLIDRLGEPAEIVAAASDGDPSSPPSPWGHGAPQLVPRRPGTGLETAAVLMLTVGSVVPVLGWLVGVVLLWTSRRWRTSEKLLGTLVVPGGPGLLLPLGAIPISSCTSVSTPPTPVPGTGTPPDVGFMPPPPGAESTLCEGGLPLPDWLVITFALAALVAPFVVAVVLLRRARARAAAEPSVLRPAAGTVWTGAEVAAVLVLGLGSFVVPVVGTVVGLALVWRSPRWTSVEKVVATALTLASVAVIASAVVGGPVTLPFALFVVVFLAVFGHVIAAVYLTVALNRRGGEPAVR